MLKSHTILKQILLVATGLFSVAIPGTASAAPVVQVLGFQDANAAFSLNSFTYETPPGVGNNSFTGITAGAVDNLTFSSGGPNSGIYAGYVSPSIAASPFSAIGQSTRVFFNAGGGGGFVQLNYLGSALTDLIVLWGTVDSGTTRNRIQFGIGMGAQVVTGDDVLGACSASFGAGACGDGDHNALVRISNLDPFLVARFSDATLNSFEFNVRAIPEPATWAMMVLGFFGIGFVAVRRRKAGPSLRIA